jgi:intracellular multiplication protein IcmE
MVDDNKEDNFDDFDDGFEEFDTKGSSGQSLKDLFSNNPMVKMGVVVAVVLIVVAGVFLITGGGSSENESQITGAPATRAVLGPDDELTPAMKQAIEETDQQQADQALRSGVGSAVPTIAFGDQDRVLSDLEGQNANDEEQDPFKQWRIKEFEEQVEQQKTQMAQEQEQFVESFDQAVSMQPDPNAVAALSDAMLAQMQAILETQQTSPISIMTVTQPQLAGAGAFGQPAGATTAFGQNSQIQGFQPQQVAQPTVQPDPVITAGTVLYAQMMTEANTDAPGPILAQIVDTRFSGAKIIGEFDSTERYITIKFGRMTRGKKSYAVQAVALDPDTNIGGIVTDYDGRYFRRVILPAAASFIEGMGSAFSEQQSTTVIGAGGATVSDTPDLNTKQEVGRGVEEAAREFGDILDDEAQQIKPLIRVAAGTPIAVFFVEDVYDPNDAALLQQQQYNNQGGFGGISNQFPYGQQGFGQQGFGQYGVQPQPYGTQQQFGGQYPLAQQQLFGATQPTQQVNQYLNGR